MFKAFKSMKDFSFGDESNEGEADRTGEAIERFEHPCVSGTNLEGRLTSMADLLTWGWQVC